MTTMTLIVQPWHNLLRQDQANKRGIKNKRFQCALDPKYLLIVLDNANI